ncbi:hypothetical protein KBA27_05680 [bacterium]|nr:hypothetical protein [bacterium]
MGIEIKIDTKTNTGELVRLLLYRKKVSIAELARRMKELSQVKYTRFNVRAKIERNSLKFSEMVLICDILGYKLDLKEIG